MIILYTTYCPKCKILEQKLNNLGVDYTIVDNASEVIEYGKSIGLLTAPILEVNGVAFDFNNAIKWVAAKEK